VIKIDHDHSPLFLIDSDLFHHLPLPIFVVIAHDFEIRLIEFQASE